MAPCPAAATGHSSSRATLPCARRSISQDRPPHRTIRRSRMSLVLYGHAFSSYTQKVLIALYENGTPFEFRSLGPDMPQHSAEWLRRWPLRKFPLLVDGARNVAETSI